MDTIAKTPNYTILGRLFGTELKQQKTAVSATKVYPLGTQLIDDVGNRYRYAKTGASSVYTSRGAWAYNYQISGHIAVPTTSAIGARVIYGTIGASDGIAADGVVALNYLEDGYVCVWHSATSISVYRILSNTAVAGGGGTIALTIDEPLQLAVTTSVETIEIMASQYIDIRTGNSGGNHAFVGQWKGEVVTATPYGWLLEDGITFIDPQAAVGTSLNQQLVFRHDGSVDVQDDSDAYAQHMQHAGHVVSYLAAGTQAAPFMRLKI